MKVSEKKKKEKGMFGVTHKSKLMWYSDGLMSVL